MRPSGHSVIALSALLAVPGALGWGFVGHEIVATIAQIHLHPSAFPNICRILNYESSDPDGPLCHLAPVAAWADKARRYMRWSGPLHYIGAVGDHPSETCLFPGREGWEGKPNINVLSGIRNVTNILEEWTEGGSSEHAANEALKFLIHLFGDLHQPLHLTGRERGGNSVKVRFDGRLTNLHSVWDGQLVSQAILFVPHEYSRPLPDRQIEDNLLPRKAYNPFVRQIVWEGIREEWKNEVEEWLSCPSTTTASITPVSSNSIWRFIAAVQTWLIGSAQPTHTDDDIVCPHYWAKPLHQINCDIAWPAALDEAPYNVTSFSSEPMDPNLDHCSGHDHGIEDLRDDRGGYLELDTPEYAGVIQREKILHKLFAKAGLRLAATLNWLFSDAPEEAIFTASYSSLYL